MNEKWVDIAGYEGLYQISNLGKVRSTSSHKHKTQSGGPGTNSRYRYVTLYKENVGTKLTVHRLVASAFVPNPNHHPYVLHIKNDKENNTAVNLKWGTQKDNINDAIAHGTYRKPPVLRGEDQPNSKLTPDKVREIRKLRKTGFTQESLARKFNVSRGTIRPILAGKNWKHVS